jgi:hypothetical protein
LAASSPWTQTVKMEPTQTALIVPLAEAEPVVRRFRASLDRAASWGVPAHVTVLYSFLPPERIDEAVLATVQDIVATVPRSDVLLTRVGWFGDTVVWSSGSRHSRISCFETSPRRSGAVSPRRLRTPARTWKWCHI